MLIHCYYSHLNIKDASFFIYINIFGNGSQLMKERGGEKSVCEGWGYCFAGKIDFPLRDGRSEVMESSPHSVTYGFIIAYFCIKCLLLALQVTLSEWPPVFDSFTPSYRLDLLYQI
jgi:hypothetical protein